MKRLTLHRLASALLCLTLALSLAACGGKKKPAPAAGNGGVKETISDSRTDQTGQADPVKPSEPEAEVDQELVEECLDKLGFDLEYGGFNCIELDVPVKIENGSSFAVVATVQNGYITLNESAGKSYLYRGGWMAFEAAPRIKAFAKIEDKPNNYVEFISESQVKVVAQSGVKQLVLVCYANSTLKDVYIEPIDFDTEKEKIISLPKEWKRTENTVYKAFLFDKPDNIRPLCRAAEF